MTLTPQDRDFVRDLVERRAGIVLDGAKDYLIDTRLEGLARSSGREVAEVVSAARRGGDTEARVVEALTTNETSFFRDRVPFDALRDRVLPELIAARSTVRRLRIWCAASSSGQEPYSIAMLLLDHFPELSSWDVQIVGTDISTEMIDRSRTGSYSQLEVGRGLPTPMLVRHFEQDGARWRIKEPARSLVTFRELNLVGTWAAMPTPDVVFLRNVLIYFDGAVKQRILSNVARLLATDGTLFLGAGETAVATTGLQRVDLGAAHAYRPATASPATTSGPASRPTAQLLGGRSS